MTKIENQEYFLIKITDCEEVTDNCVKEWLYGDEKNEITDDKMIRMITKE